MPLVFPEMLLCSTRLPLLVPRRPMPKSLLDVTVGVPAQSAAAHTDPLPPNRLFAMTLLLLLTRQFPPHGAAPELAAFRTETTPSIVLPVIRLVSRPLKQLWFDVTFLIVT